MPPAAAALPQAAAAVAAVAPLAALVPTFPRVGGQAVRDWIGQSVDNLPGFNGDDLARLLLPDLVSLVDVPTLLISFLLLLAFVYWEGGVLLRQLRERQRTQRQQRQRQEGSSGESPAGEAAAASEQQQAQHEQLQDRQEWTPLERARHERRRGLGWLALATAATIWMTGAVSSFMP